MKLNDLYDEPMFETVGNLSLQERKQLIRSLKIDLAEAAVAEHMLTLTEEEKKEQSYKILTALAWALGKGAKGIFWVITHPFQAVALAAVLTHPQGAWNLANLTWNLIADPGAVASVLANQLTPWGDKKKAADDLSSIVGGNLPIDTITAIAGAAVQYALPVAGVIALLYGGKKLYDYLKSKNGLPKEEPKPEQGGFKKDVSQLKQEPVKETQQGYHVKDHKVYGKVLARDGQTVVADHDTASKLADQYNGGLIKSMDGRRYIIKMSEAPPTLVGKM